VLDGLEVALGDRAVVLDAFRRALIATRDRWLASARVSTARSPRSTSIIRVHAGSSVTRSCRIRRPAPATRRSTAASARCSRGGRPPWVRRAAPRRRRFDDDTSSTNPCDWVSGLDDATCVRARAVPRSGSVADCDVGCFDPARDRVADRFYRRWLSAGAAAWRALQLRADESCSAFACARRRRHRPRSPRSADHAPDPTLPRRLLITDGHALSWTPLHDARPRRSSTSCARRGGRRAIEQLLRVRRAVAIWRADLPRSAHATSSRASASRPDETAARAPGCVPSRRSEPRTSSARDPRRGPAVAVASRSSCRGSAASRSSRGDRGHAVRAHDPRARAPIRPSPDVGATALIEGHAGRGARAARGSLLRRRDGLGRSAARPRAREPAAVFCC